MVGFRVTKYDPSLRLPNGNYSRDEWTSASDIGRECDGRIFTCSDYLRVETSYVDAVRSFLEASELRSLRVADLQVNEITAETLASELVEETRAQAATVVDGMVVRGEDLGWIVRLALREALWCRLKGDHGFYVHFGYDYYMYVGSEKLSAVPAQVPPGVFAEPFESPYHEEPSDEEPC